LRHLKKKKQKSKINETQEINLLRVYEALIPIEKYWTSNLTKQVCVNSVEQNIKCGIKGDKYFVDEVETQLREKPLRGTQTQDIHYSEDKTRYKVVTLTYT
jgi:hypothetical protein